VLVPSPPEQPNLQTWTLSIVYRAEDVDAWVSSATTTVTRLRSGLNDAVERTRRAERQLNLTTHGIKDIVAAANGAQAVIAAARGRDPSAHTLLACEHGDELVVEARRGALALLFTARRQVADLYRRVSPRRNLPGATDALGGEANAPSARVEVEVAVAGLEPHRVYRIKEAEEYMQALRSAASELAPLLRKAKEQAEQTEDRLETGDITPRNGDDEERDRQSLVGVAAAPSDSSNEGERAEAGRVLAATRRSADEILVTARRVVSTLYLQAEADLVGPSGNGQVTPGSQENNGHDA
jgi:hypothetical protein